MLIKKRLIFSTVICAFLIGCAALGSSVKYKNISDSEPLQIDTIMLFPLQKVKWYNDFEPNYSLWAENAISSFLVESGYKVIKSKAYRKINFDDQLVKCPELEDKYFALFPKMNFFSTMEDSTGALLGTTADVYFEVCLFNQNGQKIIHTTFNTYSGKSYFLLPHPSVTISDAAEGATKKMIKEIYSHNKKKNQPN